MPTGYTAAIADGITFKEFAFSCARGFGALVTMRDEPSDTPIPDVISPTDYHVKKLIEFRSELKKVNDYTDIKWKQVLEIDHEAEIAKYKKYRDDEIALRVKYEDMLLKAIAWEAPSKDHEGLKDFMIKQIKDSISWDCNFYSRKELPIKPALSAFRDAKINKIKSDILYHDAENKKEIQRATERTQWIQLLKYSLTD